MWAIYVSIRGLNRPTHFIQANNIAVLVHKGGQWGHLKVVAGCTHASKVVDGEVSKGRHECVENSCSYYLGCMAKSSFCTM
jgi:hypothetical protein